MPRSYQVTPAILERRRATQPPTVRPRADTRLTGQPAAEPRTYRSCRTPPPDTSTFSLRSGLDPVQGQVFGLRATTPRLERLGRQVAGRHLRAGPGPPSRPVFRRPRPGRWPPRRAPSARRHRQRRGRQQPHDPAYVPPLRRAHVALHRLNASINQVVSDALQALSGTVAGGPARWSGAPVCALRARGDVGVADGLSRPAGESYYPIGPGLSAD